MALGISWITLKEEGLPSSIFAGQNMAVHSNQTLEEVGNFGNPAVAVGRIVEDSEDSRLLQALVA